MTPDKPQHDRADSRNYHSWRMIARWDVGDDGAEDMLVVDDGALADGIKLLTKRLPRAAAPAVWCCAYKVPAGTLSRDAVHRTLELRGLGSEHVSNLAAVYDVLAWPAAVVHNVAALAVEGCKRFAGNMEWMERHGI